MISFWQRMLLYDVHTHVGLDCGFYLRGWWPYAATAQQLLEHMRQAKIDRAACFPFTLPSAFDPYAFAQRGEIALLPGRFPFDRENDLLRREIQRVDRERRLIQFAMFDPSRCVREQVQAIESIIEHIGGLKAQTTVLRSPIRSLLDEGRALMELAERHDLPVVLHTSVAPSDSWAQASDCLDVARAFPRVRFNLAHSLRFHLEHLKTAATMDNVWVDCSAHLAHCQLARENSPAVAPAKARVPANYSRPVEVLQIIQEVLGGKYLWGSDNPFMSWCADTMRIIYSYAEEAAVLHALDETTRHSMAGAAPEAWLGPRTRRP